MFKVIILFLNFCFAAEIESSSNYQCSKYMKNLMDQPMIQNYAKLWLCQLIANNMKNTGGQAQLPTPLKFE